MAPKKLPPNIEQLPSGHYRGRYVGPDGRRHSTAPYARWEQAQWALEQARGDIAKGDWIDPERAGITLNRWFDIWAANTATARMREYVREKEVTRYKNHIKPYLGSHELLKITPFTITSWHADLARDGRTAATIGKAHALLKACLGPRGGAMSDERIRVNPCQLVQPPTATRKQWRLVTVEEFNQIVAEIPEEWRALVILAAYTGLRWSEIVGLHREDYSPFRKEITVRRGTVHYLGRLIDDDPKDHEERTVPCVPKVTDALNAHIARRPMSPADRLFTATQGGTLRHPHFMERIYKPAVKRAGYVGVRFHDLRHSCASWLLNGGMDIHEVKEVLGHASITTTQLYAHTDREQVRDAMLSALGEQVSDSGTSDAAATVQPDV